MRWTSARFSTLTLLLIGLGSPGLGATPLPGPEAAGSPRLAPLPARPAHPGWLARGKVYHVKPGHHVTTSVGRAYLRGSRRPRGRLNLVKLDNGPGFVVANPKRAWGTKLAVYQINRVMALYHRRFPDDPPVVIRDLSRRRGGPLPNHVSHQDGRDVDIPVVLDAVSEVNRNTKRTINAERTWFLVRALVDSCDVDFIFLGREVQKLLHEHAQEQGVAKELLGRILQYPGEEESGVVVHWPKHLDHLHVRFRQRGAPRMKAAARHCETDE